MTSNPTSEYTPAVTIRSKNRAASADDRHVPLVAHGDVDRDEHQEHHQRDERLLGDLAAPGLRHRRVADRLLAGLAVGALGLEGVEQRGAQLASVSSLFSVSDRICTVADAPLPTITTDSASLPSVLLNTSSTCCGDLTLTRGGHRHLGAALEVDAEGEAAEHDAGDRDRDDQRR